MASSYKILQAEIPSMDRVALLEAFQQLWFGTGYVQRLHSPGYRPCLRALIQHLVQFSDSEVAEMLRAAADMIAKAFPKSCEDENLNWKKAPIVARVAELFDADTDDPERDIACCFTQLEFLAAGGFLGSPHLPQLHRLLELTPAAKKKDALACARRWKLIGSAGDDSSVDFIRELWPRRHELGYPDDFLLLTLSEIGSETAFDLVKQCLSPGSGAPVYSWARNPFLAGSGDSTTAPSDFLEPFVENEKLLGQFFPDLDPLLSSEQVDRGMWKVAWCCKEAGAFPEASEDILAHQVDAACETDTAKFEATPLGDGDFYGAMNSLQHTVGIACRFKHHPKLGKWFDWALASTYPEVRQDALLGMLIASDEIPPELIRSIAQSAFCRPSLYSTLLKHGQLDLLPAEFRSDEMIAQTAIATDVDQDGIHFPPNRMRSLGSVELDSGRYVVTALTTAHDWEPVDQTTGEWVRIVGPMAAERSLADENLPGFVSVDGEKPDESGDLKSWVACKVTPPDPDTGNDGESIGDDGSGPLDTIDPDALIHVINPTDNTCGWTYFEIGNNLSEDGEMVGFEVGVRGTKGKKRTKIEFTMRIEGIEDDDDTLEIQAESDTAVTKQDTMLYAAAPCEKCKFSYCYKITQSGSENDGVYFAVVRFPPL